jgi:hypothetical protein
MDWAPPPLSEIPPSPAGIEKAIYRLEHAMHWMWSHKQTGTARADASAITDAREELATMRAAQEFTRVVCELLGNEGSGMDVSTDVLQDMLTAAGVTP